MQSAAFSQAPCSSPLQADSASAVPLPSANAQPAAIRAEVAPCFNVPSLMMVPHIWIVISDGGGLLGRTQVAA